MDFRIHYFKANGSTTPKVFKMKIVDLAAGATARVEKRTSVADMTTRRHYPGEHEVDAVVNGRIDKLGSFVLQIP